MQKINYTPIDIEKLKGTKETNVNFYLLIAVTIVAAIFAVLLFIYIQQKNEALNAVSNTDAAEPTTENTTEATENPTPIPTVMTPSIAPSTPSGVLASPTPIKTSTATPTIAIPQATGSAKVSTASATPQ